MHGHGEERGMGIPFELRGIPGPLPFNEWGTFMIPYLTYFRELNARAKLDA